MSKYGLFITKEFKNVLKSQSPLDYIINSDFNTFKIFRKVEGSIAVPNPGSGTAEFTHGLGYIPAVIAYYRLKETSSFWFSDNTSLNTTLDDNDGLQVSYTAINSSIIKASISNSEGVPASNVHYKWFLLVDPIDIVSDSVQGLVKTTNYGFKVSKPGINVLNAKAHQLLLSSEYEQLKFHKEISLSFTISAGSTTGSKSFTHGLGYVPMFMGVVEDWNDTTQERIVPFGRVPQPIASSVKANKEVITAVALQVVSGSDRTYNFRVVIFKNKLGDVW